MVLSEIAQFIYQFHRAVIVFFRADLLEMRDKLIVTRILHMSTYHYRLKCVNITILLMTEEQRLISAQIVPIRYSHINITQNNSFLRKKQ